jgi:hypothetical protein
MPRLPDEQYSKVESEQRRDEVVRRMANSPLSHPKNGKKVGAARAAGKDHDDGRIHPQKSIATETCIRWLVRKLRSAFFVWLAA